MTYRIIFISLLFFNLFSCFILSEENKVTQAFERYQEALKKNDGEAIFNMLDDKSHDYLKKVYYYINNLDSVNVSKTNYVERNKILSGRAFIIIDSNSGTDYKSLFIKMFSSSKYGYLKDKIKFHKFDEVTLNGEEAFIKSFGIRRGIKLTKKDGEWKINLESIGKYKNQIFENTFNPSNGNSNNIDKIINDNIEGGLSYILNDKYPVDLIYWPTTTREKLLKNQYYFSKGIDCNKNQSWGYVNNNKILFFLTNDDLSINFYEDFYTNKKFRDFCSKNFNVIALTNNFYISADLLDKFDIKSFPTILVLNEKDEILKKMIGISWSPELIMENLKTN